MERVVFVDENDNAIGHGTREEAIEKGLIRRVVEVFVTNSKGELLMQKRSASVKTNPNKWDTSASGHVDPGESYSTAAMRELREELGIASASLTELKKILTEEKVTAGIARRFAMLYISRFDGTLAPDPKEVGEVKWMQPEDIKVWMEREPDIFCYPFKVAFAEFLKAART